MTIKQYLELDKIQEQFRIASIEYIKKHHENINDLQLIQNTFATINLQLQKLTQHFYNQ
jgi:hypothetical protein